MTVRLLCIVKIKVTCWQLRENQRKDEWPCLFVKVGRRHDSMNGSGLSELWDKTDSSNYGSSSKE